ncbi:MAG: hypothetical protein E7168_03815 [Firmicutes bacterium]|nr:hypothetical protein [Bacillota bacterium]
MKKIDYNKLDKIVAKSQKELDDIPLDYKGRIYIEFGTDWNRAILKNKYYWPVEARENSSVEAWENSSVVAWGNSSVEAWGNSSVEAWENSSVVARENSSVVAWGNSSVEAWGNSSVEAWGNSSVEAWENSSVVAWENSSVVAWGNSSVEAWGNSSVEAWENSSVEAWGNSSVVAWGNTQVVDRLEKGKILISGNARKVYMPKNIFEFMDFYGIKHTKKKAVFYKAVRKENDKYFSDYDCSFTYEIGKEKKEVCDSNVNYSCSYGINISYLQWAIDFGRDWDNLAILEVETKIENIVMPIDTDGKVRTCKVKVIREIPLNECGLYGQILEKRRNKDAN